ncbi:LLM class flavin-dependent oxidoreductase [Streptomyces sp. NPDC035033]|uniref:LLM class flavin-dependent oxidoreductase n=1 Tax=Streptomyces sp. NPDC035033 TaxID=3155368 RepID=UPI003411ACD7
MQLGLNLPNFGPGTDPRVLREGARRAEDLGLDLLMVSDHIVVTPDVAERYPEPFYEPFTTLSWLAGITTTMRLGTTVLVLPYRHPLLVARMAANLHRLSGGRLVLGTGTGWARQEFEALGVPFTARGRLTNESLALLRHNRDAGHHDGDIPLWIGGNSEAALRRAVEFGDAWHPLRLSLPHLRAALQRHPDLPGFAPRIALRLTDTPATPEDPDRPPGTGTAEQILDDLDQLRLMGATTVVLDPYHGDPKETHRPETAWRALTTIATEWRARS